MRLLALILFLCFSFPQFLYSQNTIGLRFGLNSSNFDPGDLKTLQGYDIVRENYFPKERKTIHFGVTSDIALKSKFGLRLELFLIGKGEGMAPRQMYSELDLNLALPILLKYEIIPKVHLLGGIESSYLLQNFFTNGFELNTRGYGSDELPPRRFNAGYHFGIEWNFTKQWGVGFRYARIFKPLVQDEFRTYDRTYMLSFHHTLWES